jgi:hypothetical protein
MSCAAGMTDKNPQTFDTGCRILDYLQSELNPACRHLGIMPGKHLQIIIEARTSPARSYSQKPVHLWGFRNANSFRSHFFLESNNILKF